MWESLKEYFSTSEFMPHGHCYLWKPTLIFLHVASDALIGIAYVSISLTLYVMVKKIKLPFSMMFFAFGVFIMACGLTHFMEIWNLWVPDYWLAAFLKVITATASVATALYLLPVMPQALKLSKASQVAEELRQKLQQHNADLETKVAERTAKLEQRSHELSDAIRVRDEFFSIASHELRTPITPIKMQLQMACEDLKHTIDTATALDAKDLLKSCQISLRQIDHLTSLVDNLLDVSRAEAGQLVLSRERLDLSALVKDIVESFGATQDARVPVTYTATHSPIFAVGDSSRISQVLYNLLTNSVKYGAGRPVAVEVYEDAHWALIIVKDHGNGISPDALPRIFDRFSRAEQSKNIGGLGLGLYITKQIVDAHGGSIDVKSEAGKGTTFTVKIPKTLT